MRKNRFPYYKIQKQISKQKWNSIKETIPVNMQTKKRKGYHQKRWKYKYYNLIHSEVKNNI